MVKSPIVARINALLAAKGIPKQQFYNVLVETEGSKARTEKRRFLINMFFTVVSAVAAVAAAIFAALTYINS